MKFNIILILLLLIFSISCIPYPVHVQKAHKVMAAFTQRMKKEGFSPESSGGAMMDDIQEIFLGYQLYKNVGIEEARIIFLEHSEALLSLINSDEEIKPYLHNYPFTSKNIVLSISFEKPSGGFVKAPLITYVFIDTNTNEIIYSFFNEEKDKLDYAHIESYDEALRIYRETVGL